MKKNKDKYDEAVEYLTEFPTEIYDAWDRANAQYPPSGCSVWLFNTGACWIK